MWEPGAAHGAGSLAGLGRGTNTYSPGVYEAVWLWQVLSTSPAAPGAPAVRAALPLVAASHSGTMGRAALNEAGDMVPA